MTNLRALKERFDYQRLAGVRSVLGLDISHAEVRVVELKRYGNPLDRFAGSFAALRWLTVSFPRGATAQEKGQLLKQSLLANEVRTSFAVSTMHTPGVRTIVARIPSELEDLNEWVAERAEKLLNLPVPSSELSFSIAPLKVEGSGSHALITFVRNSDIAEQRLIIAEAGLQLLALGAGSGDLVTAFVVSEPTSASQRRVLVQVDPTSVTAITCHDGKCADVLTYPLPSGTRSQNILQRALEGENPEEVMICGNLQEESTWALFTPFDVPVTHALAVGVALKATFPVIHPVDFLGVEEQQRLQNRLAESLFRRSLLLGGAALLLLLLLPLLASVMIQSRTENVDEALAMSGPVSAEVTALAKQVSYLRATAEALVAPSSHSNVAELLHEVARLAPKQIEFTSMTLNGEESSLLVTGRARSRESVADFLQTLQASRHFASPSLNRLRTGTSQTNVTSMDVSFEVSVALAWEVQ